MALLTPVLSSRAGVALTGVTPTASTGDTFANTGKEYIFVNNGSAGSINVTLDMVATLDGAAVTDPVVAVGAGVTKVIGPLPPALYSVGLVSGGVAKFTCSAVTDITVKVIGSST